MAVKPRNKNLGKHPLDPEYDDTYDHEAEMERYEREIEAEEEERRMERLERENNR